MMEARGFYPGATVEDAWVISSAAMVALLDSSRGYQHRLQWVAMRHAFERNSRNATGELYRCAAEDVRSAERELTAVNQKLLEACKAFHELFNDSDMRPEDECHELYAKVSEAIALATPAASKE